MVSVVWRTATSTSTNSGTTSCSVRFSMKPPRPGYRSPERWIGSRGCGESRRIICPGGSFGLGILVR